MGAACARRGLAIGIAWTGGDPENNVAGASGAWLSGFREFFDHIYGELSLQVLLLMATLGLLRRGSSPDARKGWRTPFSTSLTASSFSYSLAPSFRFSFSFAEMMTGLVRVRNIFDLNIGTGGSITLVIAAMVDFFFYGFYRCQHTLSMLWQVHMLHHGETWRST